MTSTRPVLVATDLSDHASLALQAADVMARERNAPLYVVHVMPEMYSVHALFPQLNLDTAFSFTALEQQAAEAVTKHVETRARCGPEFGTCAARTTTSRRPGVWR